MKNNILDLDPTPAAIEDIVEDTPPEIISRKISDLSLSGLAFPPSE
jgi:hypothetical protein